MWTPNDKWGLRNTNLREIFDIPTGDLEKKFRALLGFLDDMYSDFDLDEYKDIQSIKQDISHLSSDVENLFGRLYQLEKSKTKIPTGTNTLLRKDVSWKLTGMDEDTVLKTAAGNTVVSSILTASATKLKE